MSIHPNNAEVILRALKHILSEARAYAHPIHYKVREALEAAGHLLHNLESEDDEEPMCAECYGTEGTGHDRECTHAACPITRTAAR